jgi:hypothetical protein
LSKFHIGGSNPVFARIFDPSFKILDLPSDLMTWGVSHESLPLNMTKKNRNHDLGVKKQTSLRDTIGGYGIHEPAS